MDYYSSQISKLIEELSKLPGIGNKTAQRLAFYVLSLPQEEADAFAQSITQAKTAIHCCPVCQNLTEGEATAMYLARLLKPFQVRVSRLAYGIPVGSHLEYADDATLMRALEGRQIM